MKFDLNITDRLDSLDEGMEFAVNNGGEWIPLAFFSPKDKRRDDRIRVGSDVESTGMAITIRGYHVPLYNFTGISSINLKLCGSEIVQANTSLRFRWLQTVVSISDDNVDTIYLDDVQIGINSPQQDVLFKDDFNSEPHMIE